MYGTDFHINTHYMQTLLPRHAAQWFWVFTYCTRKKNKNAPKWHF